jgi:hypothetical protein
MRQKAWLKNLTAKKALVSHKRRGEDNIKRDLKEKLCEDVK